MRNWSMKLRDVYVEWHFGSTGTGKSYTYVDLVKTLGKDNIYVVTDYESGFLDNYCGQKVLFLDEFRSQIRYSKLLSMLDSYTREYHARYSNIVGLWDMVYIAGPYAPEQCYRIMMQDEDKHVDAVGQLMRRIDNIVYHYRDEKGSYRFYAFTSDEYISAEAASRNIRRGKDNFVKLPDADAAQIRMKFDEEV